MILKPAPRTGDFDVEWLDRGRAAEHPPNPEFPTGVDITVETFNRPARPACRTALPYPAKRCGLYVVTCRSCGVKTALTTAGRPDDPRSITIPCLPPNKKSPA